MFKNHALRTTHLASLTWWTLPLNHLLWNSRKVSLRLLHQSTTHQSLYRPENKTSTVNPLLTPPTPPGGLIHFKHVWGEGGLNKNGVLFHLTTLVVSVLHKEQECKVEKLKYKKLEVIQPKSKSELPTREESISDQSKLSLQSWFINTLYHLLVKTNEEEGEGLKQGGGGALNSGFTVYMYTTKHFTNMQREL